MALSECRFWSDVLGVWCTMAVIVPQPGYAAFKREADDAGGAGDRGQPAAARRLAPVLYLLHGLGDDHTAWTRRTRIEEYATAAGLAVVMPYCGRSFYADMDRGYDYWTFLTEELPFAAHALFPLSQRREDNFVAGNSMGGYGAFKWALARPDRFAAAASLSGSLHIALRADPGWRELVNIFGDVTTIADSPNDLFHLAREGAASGAKLPQLYQCCGTDDFLYEHNQAFLAHARKLELPLVYEEERESHNWAYWDRQIARVIEWLPIEERVGAIR